MTLEALARTVDRYTRGNGAKGSDRLQLVEVPGLHYLRRTSMSGCEADVYEPILCLILQGRKETIIGDRRFCIGQGQSIVVSHDLPAMAQITQASPEAPYLALIACLDLTELRSLADEVEQYVPNDEPTAYAVGTIDDALIDVMTRYTALAEDPVGVGVLAPLIRRELHYRLLMASHGAMLRTLLRRDSHASNISRAITRLRTEFRASIEVAELARFVGMSTSSFHKHFKQITATTPLQFQKDLRLTEARRLLLSGDHTVSTAAFDVGYESTTQFSREYNRKYGAPPSQHLRQTASAT